jgi:hypothetical protein
MYCVMPPSPLSHTHSPSPLTLFTLPFCLQGGQAQRISLALSIALRPDVILLDEPTSACDSDATLRCVPEHWCPAEGAITLAAFRGCLAVVLVRVQWRGLCVLNSC